MGFYAFEPPDLEESYIDKSKERQNKYAAVKNVIRQQPKVGENLEDITNRFGNNLGRDIMVGSALLGYSSISPEVQLLVERQMEIEKEQSRNFWEQTKGAGRGLIRNAIVGMDSLAEATVKRPFQAAARSLADNGMNINLAYLQMFSNLVGLDKPVMNLALGNDYAEFRQDYEAAKKELGPTQAGYAIRELAKGNRVNLGRGYFGNSTLARDTDIYKELAQTIRDPNQLAAIEESIQAQLGFDITGTERAKVEANKYKGVTISPGRVAAVQIAEPGTDRFKFVSGLIDGVVTLGFDPTNLAGAWATKLTKAGRTFKVGENVVDARNTVGIRTATAQGERVYQRVLMKTDDVTSEPVLVDVGPSILKGDKTYTLDELNDIAAQNGRQNPYFPQTAESQKYLDEGFQNNFGLNSATSDEIFINNIAITEAADFKNGKYYQQSRPGIRGNFLDNISKDLRGLNKQQLAKRTRGTPLEKYFNNKAQNYVFDEDAQKVFIDDIASDQGFFKDMVAYVGADRYITKAAYDSIEEVIDSTILHEAAHSWISKGYAPKSLSFDTNTIPRRALGIFMKGGRRKRKEKRWLDAATKAKDKGISSSWDDIDWAKTYWKLENEVNELTTNFKTAYINEIDTLKNASGIQKFLKPSLNKVDFEEWHTTVGQTIYDFIAEQIQKGGFRFQDIRKIMPEASPSTIQAMLDNPTLDNIAELVAREVRTGGISKRLDPYSSTFKGGISRKLGKTLGRNNKLLDDGARIDFSDMGNFLGVGAVISRKYTDSAIAKIFGQVSPAFISATNHTQGLREMEKLIESLPFEEAVRKDLYKKLASADAAILSSALDGNPYSKLRLTEEFFKLLNGKGTPKDAGILGELEKLLGAKTGLPGQLGGGITKFVAEIQEARKYWVSLVGDDVVDVGFGTAKSSQQFPNRIRSLTDDAATAQKLDDLAKKGEGEELKKFIMTTFGNKEEALPSAHLLSEMLVGNIPLFDPNEIFRVLGTFRNSLLKISGVGALTGLKRVDFTQLLGKDLSKNPIFRLASENDNFAKYMSDWELPKKSLSGKKVSPAYIKELQDKAIDELITEYNKITNEGLTRNVLDLSTDDDTYELFNMLTTTEQFKNAANVGNITSNAITKGIAKSLYAKKYSDGGVSIVNRGYTRFANNVMQTAWKPLTLLRFAWTTRVIMEEQLRMWAAGFSNIFTHPLSHFAWALKPDAKFARGTAKILDALPFPKDMRAGDKFVEKLRKGELDILGRQMKDEFLFKQAMSRGSNGIMIRKAASIDRFFQTVKKSSVTESRASRYNFAEGWLTELNLMADDDLMQTVAGIIYDYQRPTHFRGPSTPFTSFDELADFLVGNTTTREYMQQIRGLAARSRFGSTTRRVREVDLERIRNAYKDWVSSGDAVTDYGRRLIDGDKDRTVELLQSYAARLYDKAGGGGGFRKYVVNTELQSYEETLQQVAMGTESFEDLLKKGIVQEVDKGFIVKELGDTDALAKPMIYELIAGEQSEKYVKWVATKEVDVLSPRMQKDLDEAIKAEVGFKGRELTNKEMDELIEMVKTNYDYKPVPLGSAASENQYKIIKDILYKQTNFGPDVVKLSRQFEETGRFSKSMWDKKLEDLFDLFMSIPTNKLSRAPAFRQFYYSNLEKLADRLEADALARILRDPTTAQSMPRSTQKRLRELVPKAAGEGIGIDDLEQFDQMLKSLALTETEDLLYSLNKRSQFSQATALIFPFAEVHLEIAGTWTRLLRENPTKARRASITTQTLKEGNPFNWNFLGGDAGEDKPMIYTDPNTNEEVFVFPLLDPYIRRFFDNVQKDDLGGADPAVDVNLRTVGFVSGVNIVAGGLIPGVGPIAQVAARTLMPNMKETDALYDFIFPFGEPQGDALQQAADIFIPPWVQKIGGFMQASPENWSRQLINTQKEVLRAKLVSGAVPMGEEPRTQEEMDRILQTVKQDAMVIHLIKSAAQFSFTSPSFRWEVEVEPGGSAFVDPLELKKRGIDPDGRIFGFNTLQSVYARFLNETQDEQVATELFINVFGINPTSLIISKSKEIRRVPYTDQALEYAQENEQYYDKYADVFYYVRPDVGIDEFVMASWNNSFTDDYLGDYAARVDLDLGEYAQLQNQAAGRMALEYVRRRVNDPNSTMFIPNDDIRNNFLALYKDQLADYFVGYGDKPYTESTTDVDNVFDQLRGLAKEPELQDEEVIIALNIWLENFDNATMLRRGETGGVISEIKSSPQWIFVRDMIRQKGKELEKAYPLFHFLNRDILERYLRENEDDLIRYGYTYNDAIKGDQ